MPWTDLTKSKENEEYRWSLFERLTKDDTGEELGAIMQFYADAPYYALSNEIGRLGPHETLAEARYAVEHHSWGNSMVLYVPPTGSLDS